MEKFYKLLTYLRTTVYLSVMIYLLIAYFNWDIAWIEKQSNVLSRIAFVVILLLVWWVYDEKGNKIFEGDILDYTLFDAFDEDHQYKGVVKWIDDCFICDNSDGFNGLAWAVNQSLELEVIGNVTDNPELMK